MYKYIYIYTGVCTYLFIYIYIYMFNRQKASVHKTSYAKSRLMRTSYVASYADVLCGVLCALYSGLAACLMRTSYAESYVSYAQQPMRHKTLHRIKCKKKSYAVLCASWVLQAKVLCASYAAFFVIVFL